MRPVGLVLTAVLAGLLLAPAAPAGATRPDTLFPGQGNAGLDVLAYRVVLTDDPTTNHVEAVAHLRVRVQRPTSRLTLDLEGLDVTSVRVAGAAASYSRAGTKLTLTPAHPVHGRFALSVAYRGTPGTHVDPDGSTEGWIPTDDGSVVLSEPIGAMDWLPSDDTPGDKALFTFDVTVPPGYEVAANGTLESRTTTAAGTRFVWQEREPTAVYLATVAVGRFTVRTGSTTSVDGRPIDLRSYVDPNVDQALARSAVAAIPRVLAFEERRFGPYPFSAAGIVDDSSHVGYALETQTRPYFDGTPDIDTEVHELAHQWFGDSVGLRDWHDIWLNEGFATYAEWLWDGAHGGTTPAQEFATMYAEPADSTLWRPAPTRFTDPADLFAAPSYARGAMTLQALRVVIGDDAFFRILRTWAREHRHGTVTTADFEALAHRITGRDLGRFFHVWLERDGKPQHW